jgi:hypothetical protein
VNVANRHVGFLPSFFPSFFLPPTLCSVGADPLLAQLVNILVSSGHPQGINRHHGRMERGGLGLPKVSSKPTMPYPSMPCGQATPKMKAFSGVARPQGRQLVAVFYLDGHSTPYAFERQ